MKFNKRTHNCGQLSASDIGKFVTLNGWASQIRDLGGIIFVNLRDRYGVTQLTFNPDNKSTYSLAKELKNEFVISASGTIQKRSNSNPSMKTGEIEVLVTEAEILSRSDVPPFVVGGEITSNEDLRLKYRYLDLRNDFLKDNLILRNEVTQVVHDYFHKRGFIEIETPVLMKSTPEGARDYLVPSRIHHGKFYALPQSPQTYKQILMIAGFDKYVQLCKCFRDEDLRADRQPEFTQIDLEMSFVTQEDVFEVVEGCMKEIWQKIKGIELNTPFRKLTHDEVLSAYGIDKPDLRYGMKIIEITDELRSSEFKVFSDAINSGGIAAGIKLIRTDLSRKKLDEQMEFARSMGFGGLAHIKVTNNEISSSFKKYVSEETLDKIVSKFSEDGNREGTIFILSGEKKKVCESLGKVRIKLAEEYLSDEIKNKYEFLWVTDFPLVTWDEKENRFAAEHHPFTSPKEEFMPLLDSTDKDEIKKIKADCYDLVLNGSELGSGSIRIHKSDIQSKVFKIIGLSDEEAKEKFGFLLEAFRYGAPPHGGAAFGFDRIVALLDGQTSIKDFIAFPKTTNAMSLMDGSPGKVDDKQLDELGIKIADNK
ncbi:MAG: aspartate--tRNA ligase [Ignavibacteria bacterium]|jgi:aspartyl-tRNA synthetase